MKSILFASTALVATAGIASAEIALTGSAEMGVVGGDGLLNTGYAYTGAFSGDPETQFHTDVDVTFTMTGETDNGLSFSAVVDLDENGAFASRTQGGETLSISAAGATLTMGDTDGAFDAALTEVGIGGSIDDAHTTHAGYSGNSGFDGTYDGQIARFSYTFDSFTGHLSVELNDTGALDPVWGLGVAYNAELAGLNIGVGLGYQTRDDAFIYDEIWGISLSSTFDNGLQAIVNYSNRSDSNTNVDDLEHWALGLGYTMNALTIGVNYGEFNTTGVNTSGWGLAVNYDLGGGAEIQFGYGSEDTTDIQGANIGGVIARDGAEQFSLGVAMSF